MPELPEVETIKNALEKAVGGACIQKTEIFCRRFRVPVPNDLAKRIDGARIVAFNRIAKYIIVRLDNGLSLIWHLGMSGRVKICDRRPDTPEKHDHIIFSTDKGCIIFNDARRFGLLTCCPTEELAQNPLLQKLGIDAMDKDFDGNYLYQKFHNKSTAVKMALLDQHIVCGIGNIYASEALFDARILPQRPATNLSKKECAQLAESVKAVLRKAIKAGGSTLKDYRRPDGSMGYFQNEHCVYNKTGQRCPNCVCDIKKTGGVQKTVLGGRSTFYCATLQK